MSLQDNIETINKQIGNRLKSLRILLLLTYADIEASVKDLSRKTVARIEEGKGANISSIGLLILFYGYQYHEFMDFSKPLPSTEQLKERMKKFHEELGSDAYKIIYKQPALIDLIEHKLLKSPLFDQWITEKDVYNYCEEQFGYKYSSIPNTLTLAAEKGFLKLEPGSSPKKYIRS